MEHLSNHHKDSPNQHKNSHKLCDEMGHPVVNLMESQWKLRQQHDPVSHPSEVDKMSTRNFGELSGKK